MLSEVWTLIIVIIFIVIVVMKIANKKQELAVKLTLFLFIVLMLTMAHVYVKTGASLENSEKALVFGKSYMAWLGSVFTNLKFLTADATGLDWDVKNKTAKSKR